MTWRPFMRLHVWLHSGQERFFTWPDWWCKVLNKLGGTICVELTPKYRAHPRKGAES